MECFGVITLPHRNLWTCEGDHPESCNCIILPEVLILPLPKLLKLPRSDSPTFLVEVFDMQDCWAA